MYVKHVKPLIILQLNQMAIYDIIRGRTKLVISNV